MTKYLVVVHVFANGELVSSNKYIAEPGVIDTAYLDEVQLQSANTATNLIGKRFAGQREVAVTPTIHGIFPFE
jgi:hypothetical protein